MEYRSLGRTGLNVSVMSMGSAAIGPVTTAQAADCVHAAIDAGVNLVDTAVYYGVGLAESILGEVSRRLARQGHALYQGLLAGRSSFVP